MNESATQVTPSSVPARGLNSAERLAFAIVGRLGLSGYLDRGKVSEPETLKYLVDDVAEVIQEALPLLDIIELQRVQQGQ